MRRLYCLALLAVLGPPALAQRLLVPDQYPTIQQAIDAAADGDTVLVAEGTYVENVRFRGKAVVVASHFALDRDPAHIAATVIDGSQPAEPDTASVVLFIDGEGPGSVLEGFTLTGGTGTAWRDEHSPGTYVEGGGVLAALSSPTIRYNRIVGNRADRRPAGITSAGGGGIRVGDGAPVIEHNVIAGNRGMYGGGLVANYASATIRNNVIADNVVDQAVAGAPTFGGGGLWTNGTGATLVENNTFVGNHAEGGGSSYAGRGGGVLAANAMTLTLRNNVVWGNTQAFGGPVALIPGTAVIHTFYNDVEGGYTSPVGTHVGDVDADPAFADADYHLAPASPVVDAGDPDAAFDDPEDPDHPGQAAPPAQGTVRADMGAYGGPEADDLVAVPTAAEPTPLPTDDLRGVLIYPNPTRGTATLRFDLGRPEDVSVRVYDVRGALVRVLAAAPLAAGAHALAWDGRDAAGRRVAAGRYLVEVRTREGAVVRPLVALR